MLYNAVFGMKIVGRKNRVVQGYRVIKGFYCTSTKNSESILRWGSILNEIQISYKLNTVNSSSQNRFDDTNYTKSIWQYKL